MTSRLTIVAMRQEGTNRGTAFVSYSRKDGKWLNDLHDALAPLAYEGQLVTFIDVEIAPNAEWRAEIETNLRESKIAIILLSQAFVASRFIRETELPVLLQRWENQGLPIFVVVVSAYDEAAHPKLNEIQSVNAKSRPLDQLPTAKRKQVWVALASAIRDTIAHSSGTILQSGRDNEIDGAVGSIEHRSPGDPKSGREAGLFLIPHRRNPYFAGRQEELERIHNVLQEEGKAGVIQATKGLGGLGKTQLALEYAYRHASAYQHVLWVQADSKETLDRDFEMLAAALNLHTGMGSVDEVCLAVRGWLTTSPNYLLILDNADEPEVAASCLPPGMTGKILVTSRSSDLGPLRVAFSLCLNIWSPREGAEFLLLRTQAGEDQLEDASWLTEKLGGLPIALEQAAAYISEIGTSIAEYSAEFDPDHAGKLGQVASEGAVAITWSTNLKEIESVNPASIDLLRIAAFLAPDQIPFEIFELGAQHLPGRLAEKLANDQDHLAMGELLGPLRRYSWINLDLKSRTFGVHRLVQAVVTRELTEQESDFYSNSALESVYEAFPWVDYAAWPGCERLISHALTVVENARESTVTADLLARCGDFLKARGDYPSARRHLERALAIYERLLGTDQPNAVGILDRLAHVMRVQGDLGPALLLSQKALAVYEFFLGPDHPSTARALGNLANLLYLQGDAVAARPLYERAVAISERVLGSDHENTAAALGSFATFLYSQGNLAAARPVFERALAIDEKVLGPDHPVTSDILNNLAALLKSLGDLASARVLFERALAIRERELGAAHPSTAESLNNLAALLESQGDLASASPLFERALAIREQVFGPDHPLTAKSISNLADLLMSQGELVAARPLFDRVLAIRERVLGPDDLDTAKSLTDLARLSCKEGSVNVAASLQERSLRIQRAKLPDSHPDVTLSCNNLAYFYHVLGRDREAHALLREAQSGEAKWKRMRR